MLVLACAGSAVAATQITSKQIKDGTIQSVDVKDSSLTSADVKSSSLTGTDVKNGSLGPAELSPAVASGWYSGAIPSGVTVTGYVELDTTGPSVSGDYRTAIDLPGEPGKVLTDDDVNFAPSASAVVVDGDPTCTGTVPTPTAPPGKLCTYLDFAAPGTTQVSAIVRHGRWPVMRLYTDGTSNDAFVRFSWAYTAP